MCNRYAAPDPSQIDRVWRPRMRGSMVNYPAGPFEWLAAWDAGAVVRLLDALDAHHRGERYRVSPGLRWRVGS